MEYAKHRPARRSRCQRCFSSRTAPSTCPRAEILPHAACRVLPIAPHRRIIRAGIETNTGVGRGAISCRRWGRDHRALHRLCPAPARRGGDGARCGAGRAGRLARQCRLDVTPSLAAPVPSPGLIATSLRWMLRSDSPLYIRPRLDPAFLRWTLRFWRHCNARDFLAGTEAIAAFGARSLALYDAMREAGVRYEEHRDGLLFAYRTTEALDHDYAALEPVRRFGFEISPIMSGRRIARPGAVALGDGQRRLLAAAGALGAAGHARARADRLSPGTGCRGTPGYAGERHRDGWRQGHGRLRRGTAHPRRDGRRRRRGVDTAPPQTAAGARPDRGRQGVQHRFRSSAGPTRSRCGDRSTCTRRESPLPRWTA